MAQLEIRFKRFVDIAELCPGEATSMLSVPLARCQIPQKDLSIEAGESTWGTYGYVEATNLSDGSLRWLLFLTDSDPFKDLNVQGEEIEAINTRREHFLIPIAHPEQVRVLEINGRTFVSKRELS